MDNKLLQVLSKINKYIIGIYLSIFVVNAANAGGGASNSQSLGKIVGNVQGQILTLYTLIVVIAYVVGVGFALAGILQFKAHKDNPTSVPLSKPIVLLAVGASLLFLPSILGTAGSTLFGSSNQGPSITAPSTSNIQPATN